MTIIRDCPADVQQHVGDVKRVPNHAVCGPLISAKQQSLRADDDHRDLRCMLPLFHVVLDGSRTWFCNRSRCKVFWQDAGRRMPTFANGGVIAPELQPVVLDR